ncbi:MAG TPA: prenyltransferase [Acidimicrobiales bacterium]|nr:prenyltransferase [Acidimicrobiales bacterium]
MTETSSPPTHTPLLARWKEVLRTTNPPASGEVDVVSKWLVLTRAAVLPMTITAGAVAGLLAVRQDGFSWGWYLLALLGITLAHVSNNLMNDLFDTDVGLDTESYPRALYAPHPVLSGMISRKGLATSALLVNVADLAIGIVLFVARGWPVLAFAFAGFFLSAAYTAPPLRLKKRGLGEPDVFVVWGPLMVGGTYYSAVGEIPWEVIAASVPYGLLCTAVLMGKHIDKIPWDAREGIKTLPVLLGERRARVVTQGLMVGFYVTVAACVAVGALPWPVAIVALGIPVLIKASKAFAEPRPDAPPRDFPVWPLWFAAIAFLHTRRAGALLVLGLLVAAIADITPYGLS